jgi:hypothetical protein
MPTQLPILDEIFKIEDSKLEVPEPPKSYDPRKDMFIFADNYQAVPLKLDFSNMKSLFASVAKYSAIISRCAARETFFSDFTRGCNGECDGFCTNRSTNCQIARAAVIRSISKPDAIAWEVWKTDAEENYIDLVGILRLERVTVGCDATAHYFFFDGKLRDKTKLLRAWNDWLFSDHEGWTALNRITIEMPAFMFALARHAVRKLGFGGPYDYSRGKTTIPVEGVKQNAFLWRGDWHDILSLGKERD